jgi:hypothetical protein
MVRVFHTRGGRCEGMLRVVEWSVMLDVLDDDELLCRWMMKNSIVVGGCSCEQRGRSAV